MNHLLAPQSISSPSIFINKMIWIQRTHQKRFPELFCDEKTGRCFFGRGVSKDSHQFPFSICNIIFQVAGWLVWKSENLNERINLAEPWVDQVMQFYVFIIYHTYYQLIKLCLCQLIGLAQSSFCKRVGRNFDMLQFRAKSGRRWRWRVQNKWFRMAPLDGINISDGKEKLKDFSLKFSLRLRDIVQRVNTWTLFLHTDACRTASAIVRWRNKMERLCGRIAGKNMIQLAHKYSLHVSSIHNKSFPECVYQMCLCPIWWCTLSYSCISIPFHLIWQTTSRWIPKWSERARLCYSGRTISETIVAMSSGNGMSATEQSCKFDMEPKHESIEIWRITKMNQYQYCSHNRSICRAILQYECRKRHTNIDYPPRMSFEHLCVCATICFWMVHVVCGFRGFLCFTAISGHFNFNCAEATYRAQRYAF